MRGVAAAVAAVMVGRLCALVSLSALQIVCVDEVGQAVHLCQAFVERNPVAVAQVDASCSMPAAST